MSKVKRLPTYRVQKEILKAIADDNNFVSVISGSTGCGKSTAIPLMLFEDTVARDHHCRIVVTQPRRMAAINLSTHMHNVIGIPGSVGHRVKLERNDPDFASKIVYMTTGYLYNQLLHEPERLKEYSHIILDEVHERTVEMDKLLLLLKELILRQFSEKDLNIIVMSATLDGAVFRDYFAGINPNGDPPNIVEIPPIKRYDVKQFYLDDFLEKGPLYLNGDKKVSIDQKLPNKMKKVKDKFMKQFFDTPDESADVNAGLKPLLSWCIEKMACQGDTILVFLPGVQEITGIQEFLLDWQSQFRDTTYNIIPLHRQIPLYEQKLASRDAGEKSINIILATNVAESSITFGSKLSLVIDFCLQKRNTYSYERGVTTLGTGWASQAALKQRAGRTGRTCEGLVVRLIPKEMYEALPAFDQPEVKQCNLDTLFLQIREISRSSAFDKKVTNVESIRRQGIASHTPKQLLMAMPTPVGDDAADRAILSLFKGGALQQGEEDSGLTYTGTIATEFGLDVPIARMLYMGVMLGCLPDAIIMAAACVETGVQPATLFQEIGAPKLDNPPRWADWDQWRVQQQDKWMLKLNKLIDVRRLFDEDSYSEPIMARNLVKAFLEFWLALYNTDHSALGLVADEDEGKGIFQESDQMKYMWRLTIKMFDQHYLRPKGGTDINWDEWEQKHANEDKRLVHFCFRF